MMFEDSGHQAIAALARALKEDYPGEIEIILRLGAIANALLMVGRRAPEGRDRPHDHFDAFLMTMLAAAHIYVAIKQLEKRHDGLWWRLAERGQRLRPLPLDLVTLRERLTKDSSFAQTCARIRDKYIFHVDPDPFDKYVSDASDENRRIQLFSLAGTRVEDVLFPASYEALFAAVPELSSPGFDRQVNEVVHAFPYMVEAIVLALSDLIDEKRGLPPTERRFKPRGNDETE